jgi:hypothetical protein
MHVPQQLLQIRIRIDQRRVVPLREEMTRRFEAPLRRPGILPGDAHHQPAERLFAYLDHSVHMVRHVAEGVQPCGEAIDDFSDQAAQPNPVSGCEEDVLTMIAAQRDVVDRARYVKTKRSSHRA